MITSKKMDDNFMNETMDIRRFMLCLLKCIWVLFLAGIIGAALGAGIYKLYYAITDGEISYQIRDDYYVVFNEKDYPNGMDYYNAYTWNEFSVDDKIVDYALEQTDGVVTKEDIRASVTSYMPSDYRVVTIVITNTDKEKLLAISEAYKLAMPHFAEAVNELSAIELWSCGDITVANEHNLTVNAAILGAIIALLIAVFVWLVYYCMDGRIYVENDWKKLNLQIPFLGYDSQLFKEDTDANIKALIGDNKVRWTADVKEAYSDNESEEIVLQIPMGKRQRTAVEYDLDLLKKQNKKVVGVILTECDECFLRRYYGKR